MRVIQHIKTRSAAIIVLIGLIMSGGLGVSIPVTSLFSEQNERIDASLKRLAVYRAQTATQPQLERQLRDMERAAASLPGLIKTENASVAAAQMQGELKTIVERSRGEVRTTQILPPASMSGFEQVSVKSELSVPITSLREILHSVETHVPYFFIERMTITGPRDWPSDLKSAPEPRLQINWTVHAFRRSAPK